MEKWQTQGRKREEEKKKKVRSARPAASGPPIFPHHLRSSNLNFFSLPTPTTFEVFVISLIPRELCYQVRCSLPSVSLRIAPSPTILAYR